MKIPEANKHSSSPFSMLLGGCMFPMKSYKPAITEAQFYRCRHH